MDDLDEEKRAKQAIFGKYKYALQGLGVDLSRDNVSYAIEQCYQDFETILQAFVLWALYREKQDGKSLEYPSAGFIQAIAERWQPFDVWSDEILDNPRFQSPGIKWWQAAAEGLGRDVRNQLIADVKEEVSPAYVLFRNGLTLRLSEAWEWDWERIREYGDRNPRTY